MTTQQEKPDLPATHEVYGYVDSNNEPVEMTDPEPVRIYDNELYTPTGDCVGICRDEYKKSHTTRPCTICQGAGEVNRAKNRHYEDMVPCPAFDCRDGNVRFATIGEKSGAKRWVMPNHNTTLLLRRLPDQIPYVGLVGGDSGNDPTDPMVQAPASLSDDEA